jgi:hypothetical protein
MCNFDKLSWGYLNNIDRTIVGGFKQTIGIQQVTLFYGYYKFL